jgi:murein DD-endopeptidase MepM/ murein hydrolase activator NlpD
MKTTLRICWYRDISVTFSHKERAALDFKMKRGTKILAARDGVVVRIKEDGQQGRVK